MKIWIAKNSEVPVREQLIAQITLGIAAGDFAVGQKLPSTREIARRCDLHPNTVGSAYQKLAEQNLLEFKQGSGFYVAEAASDRIEGARRVDQLIDELFAKARDLGFDEASVIGQLERRRAAEPTDRIIVVESDAALREILVHETSAQFPNTRGASLEEFSSGVVPTTVVIAAMLDEKPKIDPNLRGGQRIVYLKGRSVSSAMSGETRPGPDEIVAVVSGWDGFLTFAKIMLLAAKLDPGNIIVRSTRDTDWKRAIGRASIVICDSLTAETLDGHPGVRPFSVVSDASLDELANTIAPP